VLIIFTVLVNQKQTKFTQYLHLKVIKIKTHKQQFCNKIITTLLFRLLLLGFSRQLVCNWLNIAIAIIAIFDYFYTNLISLLWLHVLLAVTPKSIIITTILLIESIELLLAYCR